MLNLSLSAIALSASIAFYVMLNDAIKARQVETPIVDVWHCDGWAGKMYPNEKSMKEEVK